MKKLIILDFDGTIYRGDSMLQFAKFCNGSRYFFSMICLFWIYPLHLFQIIDRNQLKNIFIRINFKGISRKELVNKGTIFYELKKDNIYPNAKRFIRENHQNELVIVSGSCHEWLLPFSQNLNIPLICSELDYFENNQTCKGHLKGKNVSGLVKNELIENRYNLNEYQEIYSYGNSTSDRFLAKISTKYFHKAFEND